ncbi:cold-shock protein [Streptomyces albidoflavus]|uniref:cold-shock protein n=1 Tax=Streptomyces albidoflavus TaxID=1886 RepID=UPI00344E937E
MLKTGKILRFDEVRGYGFIVPNEGGEDVFMHANDLVDEKYLYQSGREVEFFEEMGEKGPKASQIRLVYRSSPRRSTPAVGFSSGGPDAPRINNPGVDEPETELDEYDDQDEADTLTVAELRTELTDLLLDTDDTLTADQIKRIRTRVTELARVHGWVAS